VRKKTFVFSKEEFCSEFYAMKRNVMRKRRIFYHLPLLFAFFANVCDYSAKMWRAFLFADVRFSFKQVKFVNEEIRPTAICEQH
jgi:hypothetical protein